MNIFDYLTPIHGTKAELNKEIKSLLKNIYDITKYDLTGDEEKESFVRDAESRTKIRTYINKKIQLLEKI